MIKRDIVVRVAGKCGMTQKAADHALRVILQEIGRELHCGRRVILRGFGQFKPLHKNGWEVENHPRWGGEYRVPARTRVRFQAGRLLKKAVDS